MKVLNIFSKPFNQLGKWLGPTWSTVLVIVVRVVVTAVVTYFAGPQIGNAVGAAVAAGLQTGLNGGDYMAMHKAAAIAFLSSYLGGYVDKYGGGAVTQAAGHGVVGGTSNAAMGGKFSDGFISSASSSALTSAAGYSGIGNYSPGITETVIGGTTEVIGGGKFANGAKSAVFDYLVSSTAEHGVEYYSDGGSSRRGTWITPEGEDPDLGSYDSYITNGILGDRESFQDAVNRRGDVAGYYNPSHGFIFDIVEVFQQKFFGSGGDPLTAGFAEGVNQAGGNRRLAGHSQGALTVMNSVLYYGVRASSLEFRSAAMGRVRAAYAATVNGSGFIYNTPYFDDANIYTSMNPLKAASGFLDPIAGTIKGYPSRSIHSENGF